MNISMKIPMALLIAALPLTVQAQTKVGSSDKTVQQRQVDQRQMNDKNLRNAADHASLQRISQQLNKNVYGMDDKKIGVIEDIVLDGQDNRVSYAVLSFGGVMGMGEKYFAIPWSSFEHRADQKDRVYLNIAADRLKDAPGFDKNNWPDTASASYRNSVDTYYGVDDQTRSDWYNKNKVQRPESKWQRAPASVDTTMERNAAARDRNNNNRAANTGKDVNHDVNHKDKDARASTADKSKMQNDRSRNVDGTTDRSVNADRNASDVGPRDNGLVWSRRVSSILGTDVRNSKAEDIGEINDLIIDPRTGDVQYAILSFGGLMGMGDKLFAVPMDRIQTSSADREFAIDISKETLKNAKGFEDNSWPDWNDAQYQNSVDTVFKDQPRYGNSVNYSSTDRREKADRRNNVDRNNVDRNNADRTNDKQVKPVKPLNDADNNNDNDM